MSFVAQENIASVFMYGDMLTELNFNLNDEKFQQIKNCRVKRINNSFCEFECEKLLPLKNYSLQNLENVKLFLELIPKEASLIPLATFRISGSYYWERLESYGYHDSAEVIRRISHIIEKHPNLNSKEALNIYEEFVKKNNL